VSGTEPGMSPGVDDIVCPYGCVGEPKIKRGGHKYTLLGSMGGPDPNHHWLHCRCLACERDFCKEWKRELVCYSMFQTDKLPRLLRGAPVCFEEFENDPRKGQCRHSHMNCVGGKWHCVDCGGVPGTATWVPW
jgi:hypothetical protein